MLSVGKVGFLGGGKMAQAMMKGLINAGADRRLGKCESGYIFVVYTFWLV